MFKRNITSLLTTALLLTAQFVPQQLAAQLDTSDRWIVRDFFNYVYPFGSDAELEWTGTYDGDNSTAGDISDEWREATRMRINFYRHLAGLTPNVTLNDPAKNAASQQSALILSDTNALNHFPTQQDSVFYTSQAAEASAKGNIALGSTGIYAVDGYMVDTGPQQGDSFWNQEVGHRRWILYPQADIMGSGDVPGSGFGEIDSWAAANTIWVQPANPFATRPATRDDFVAWPPKGYVPADLVWSRWSLSYPGADFSSATVSMTGPSINNYDIEYFTEPDFINGAPESTIVWVPNSMDRTKRVNWPIGDNDEEIQVSVANVTVGGQPVGPFNYTVTIFDPEKAGSSEIFTTIESPAVVNTQTPANFPVTQSRSWKEGLQGRTFDGEPFSEVFDAENGLGSIETQTSGNYDVILSNRAGNATNVFRLLQENSLPQILNLPGTYLVGSNQPQLSFLSNLSFSTEIQLASVQVNAGDGYNWQTVWSKAESVTFIDTFDPVPIDLSNYSNRTIAIRFKYELTAVGNWYGQDEIFVGWAFDDITLTDVQQIANVNLTAIESNQELVTATFPDTTPTYIQARDIAFSEMGDGGFALDWGPAILVTPESGGFTLSGTPVDAWQEHATVGLIFGASAEWVYSYHMNWLYVPNGDWLYSGIGWVKYLTGNLQDGLWLYHMDEGFIYVHEAYPGAYLRSPFSGEPETWGSFSP